VLETATIPSLSTNQVDVIQIRGQGVTRETRATL
jgi:hypothetical protein